MSRLKSQTEIQFLKGVGPRRAEALAAVGIKTVADLLYYLPRKYLDRTQILTIDKLKANLSTTVVGKVMGKGILKGKSPRLEVILGDTTGYLALIWFNRPYQFEKMFKKGDVLAATGDVTYFQQLQMVHPEIERMGDEDDQLIHAGRIVPVYPSTSGLKSAMITGRVMRLLVMRALEEVGETIAEYLPPETLTGLSLPSLAEALQGVHYPAALEQAEKARRRLAFDELLDLQYLILSLRREKSEIEKAHRYHPPGEKVRRFIDALSFRMTDDQNKTVGKLFEDMQSPRPMHRLLQGDVGCGKTVVAVSAAVFAAENKLQSAIMAPTELLAEQHFQTWREPLLKIGIESALLTGSLNAPVKKSLVDAIGKNQAQIVFGTHAILSHPVEFERLGLVVIDEQHRFGVMQRGKLISKGNEPDTLIMTATPIPRTLALTLYGDLDISSIKTMPPGRRPTRTVWRTANSRPEIFEFLKTQVKAGEQVFLIYPLVEKSDKIDLLAAEEEFKNLRDNIFKDFRVGLVHGRIKAAERDQTIRQFRDRELDILAATTVVEVGLDIPSANFMVIEHAERFGLAQLHQLRGRVGRGGKRATVIALAVPPLSELARARLDYFAAHTDGFKIAEADLELRGPGEFFGTRQHGLPELKIANLVRDGDLLEPARKLATELLLPKEVDGQENRKMKNYLEKKAAGRRNLTNYG